MGHNPHHAVRFDYEDPKAKHRLQRLVLILWKDAFNDLDLLELATAREQLVKGMPMFSAGILLEDENDVVVIAQDFLSSYSMVRNVRSIPKSCIIEGWVADINWTPYPTMKKDILVDDTPMVLASPLKPYEGWKQ